MSSEQFNQDYFENGIAAGVSCYTNYRWLPDLTVPMARAIASHLQLEEHETILDFGCAKGYLVKALRGLGFQAYGVDVSEYAISQADEFTKWFVRRVEPGTVPAHAGLPWSCIIAKDVLEHLTEEEVSKTLRQFYNLTHRCFIVVPLGNGCRFFRKYVIPEMEKDVTHKVRRPLEWWKHQLYAAGFNDVQARYSLPGIKENWTSRYPHGNGFFIAQ